MPLPIELVKAQLKVWEYKCVLIVGKPHWPYAYKTTETYTYEYAMLTPSPHKMKLVLTHHVDAHPIPYLHVEVATADKKSSYQKPDIMNKPILIGSLLELKIINERIHCGTQFPTKFEWRSTWGLHRSGNPYSFLGWATILTLREITGVHVRMWRRMSKRNASTQGRQKSSCAWRHLCAALSVL